MEKRFTFAIFAFLLGAFGAQEFLIGNNFRGVLGILFCWTGIPAIVAIIQIVIALTTSSDEEFVKKYPNCKIG